MLSMLSTVVAAAAVAASAPQPTPGQAVAQAAATPAKPKLVCRSELPTGSRLGGVRICKTQAEWDDIARRSRDTLDDSVRRGMTITCPKGVSC